MLVLSRRPGESIIIGGQIVVTVIEVRGGQVRIGIDAPRSIDVHREEIYREVLQENIAAVESSKADLQLLRNVERPAQAKRSESTGEDAGATGAPSDP